MANIPDEAMLMVESIRTFLEGYSDWEQHLPMGLVGRLNNLFAILDDEQERLILERHQVESTK